MCHYPHLYMMCKSSKMQLHILCNVQVHLASSAQNVKLTPLGGAHTCTHYSPIVQVSPMYDVILQSHRPISPSHKPLFAHGFWPVQTGGTPVPVGNPWFLSNVETLTPHLVHNHGCSLASPNLFSTLSRSLYASNLSSETHWSNRNYDLVYVIICSVSIYGVKWKIRFLVLIALQPVQPDNCSNLICNRDHF